MSIFLIAITHQPFSRPCRVSTTGHSAPDKKLTAICNSHPIKHPHLSVVQFLKSVTAKFGILSYPIRRVVFASPSAEGRIIQSVFASSSTFESLFRNTVSKTPNRPAPPPSQLPRVSPVSCCLSSERGAFYSLNPAGQALSDYFLKSSIRKVPIHRHHTKREGSPRAPQTTAF